MALANENYLKTPEIYCFDEIEKRVNAYKVLHPNAKIIRLGVGDVTRPLPNEVVQAMHTAVDELAQAATFRGYSPPQGYDFLIEKLETYLKEELGLKIKNYYFISETFFNRDEDKTAHKKIKLLLQHLVGYKTDGNKFTNEEIPKYEKIYFYDDEVKTLNLAKSINDVLRFILSNTESDIKSSVESLVKENEIILDIKGVTYNKVNMFTTSEVKLSIDRIMKTYERFINRL